ncbi:MAG TPA: phage portal protein [Armatimonadota bacterium]|jgi:PBSX family phage portal protein
MPTVSKRLGASAPPSQQAAREFDYERHGAVRPPVDLQAVARSYQEDSDVYICVNTLASAVCGRGFEVTGAVSPETKSRWEAFFADACPEGTLMEVLKQVVIDLNLLGTGYLEVARDDGDQPAALYWIPGAQMLARRDGRGFVQDVSGKAVLFNPYTPEAARRARLRRDGHWFQGANEVLQLRLPNPNSRYYGLPPAFTVAKDILADSCCRDSNLAFFRNGLCPDFAVVVKGGSLSDETATLIREYLSDAHQGPDRHHGYLILEALPGPKNEQVEIELVPMQKGFTEMQFTRYRQSNAEAKVRAFRVPMSKAGINQHGRLGEASSLGEDVTFKAQVVEPQQTMVEHALTRMLRLDLGVLEACWRFKEIDLRDELEVARTASLLAGGQPLLTVDEARAMLGLGPLATLGAGGEGSGTD